MLAVVFSHIPFSKLDSQGVPGNGVFPNWLVAALTYGANGVTLFLVISGFCIHLSWARLARYDSLPKFIPFWKRRLLRLYPPYLAALLGTLLATFILFGVLGHHREFVGAMFGYASTSQLLTDLLLLILLMQNFGNASSRIGNPPFWSLALEEQLYFLYFAAIRIRTRLGWRATWLISLSVSLGWRALIYSFPSVFDSSWLRLGPSRWFEWLLGAYAAEAHFGHVRLTSWTRSGWCCAGLLVFAIAITPQQGTWQVSPAWIIPRDLVWGLDAFIFLNWACSSKNSYFSSHVARPLAYLGMISYSIYLVHEPIIVGVKHAMFHLGIESTLLISLARLSGAVLGGLVFYKLIESRFIRSQKEMQKTLA